MLFCCLRRNVEDSWLLCWGFVVVSRYQLTPPLTRVTGRWWVDCYSPWSVAAECITPAGPSVHSTRRSQILAQNRDFCLPHAFDAPVRAFYDIFLSIFSIIMYRDSDRWIFHKFISPSVRQFHQIYVRASAVGKLKFQFYFLQRNCKLW